MKINYKEAAQAYTKLFKQVKVRDSPMMYKVTTNLYMALYQLYEESAVEDQVKICHEINDNVLPKVQTAIDSCRDVQTANKLFDLYRRLFAMSARRIMANMALYIESQKTKKIWDKTLGTMDPVFFYGSKFVNEEQFLMLRASCMPGLGKSYFGNILVANIIGNDPNATILRITYSDDLVKTTTRQTKAIIQSKAFEEIFPRYAGKARFKNDDNYSFVMCDCEDENQFFAVTRDGQSTGKRAKYLIIDDLLKGEIESSNTTLHAQLVNRFDSDWTSRADDDLQKICLLGTMWAHTDLLNVVYDREVNSDDCQMVEDENRKFTIASDEMAFISIPALDENGESTCSLRFSTKKLLKKRREMSEYLWAAVYQQNPIAPEGLGFTWSALQQYERLPKLELEAVYASLDPARRGKNYVSMPIFNKYKGDDRYFLVDFLYKKKSMKELYDDIVEKIISNNVLQIVIENNTDTSLKEVLEERLRRRRYYKCTIIEKYSTENKEIRISNHQGSVRNSIVYPKKGLYPESTDIGKAMASITSHSFDYPNKFDDAIDSIVLFIQQFIDNLLKMSKPKSINRRKRGI